MWPQPLLPPVLVGTIDEARVQSLLESARSAGMFRQVTYADPDTGISFAFFQFGSTHPQDAVARASAMSETAK